MNPSEAQVPEADAAPNQGAQATQQAKPASHKGQAKDRTAIMHQAAIKKAVAVDMIAAGASLLEITKAIGCPRKSKTIQFLERGGVKVPQRLINECKAKRATETEKDYANLTTEQLERAAMLGITPGRFAYLLTCERGTSPFSHPAPGNAYTRNIV